MFSLPPPLGMAVFGVGAGEGIADGFAQEAFRVRLADALRDGVLKRAADDPDILADLEKQHGQSRILADRQSVVAGDVGVLQDFGEHLAADGRRFLREGAPERIAHVVAKRGVGGDEQVAHRFGDASGGDAPQALWLFFVHKRSLHAPAEFQGFGNRHLVDVFQIAAHRHAHGDARDPQGPVLEHPHDEQRRGFAVHVGIGG